jgi:hypothetical protein
VGAVGLEALDVEVEGVFAHREAALGGDLVLALLDLGVEEFLHPAALQAHQVVVVVAFVELEDGLARFEVMALEEAGLFELGEDPIDGGQADIHVFGDQEAIDVFGGEMAILDLLEQVEDLQRGKVALRPILLRFWELLDMEAPKTGLGGRKPGRPRMI